MSFSPLPKSLGVYYGWPSAVNGAGGDVNTAVLTFKEYDQVVFGAGLEDPAHGDHANLVAILAHPDMASVQAFGYIDATLATEVVQDKIDQWYDTGVQGIFFDQFGYDFGLTRQKQNQIVWCVHEKGPSGMPVFANAWNPDDVFLSTVDPTHNPTGDAPRVTSGDWYLLESYQIVNGAYQTQSDWRVRSDKAIAGRTALGVSLGSVTTYDASAFDQDKADYSYLSAVVDELDSWGWGEEIFSASSALLPWITRATVDGTQFTGPLVQNGTKWDRPTNVGIQVDTSAHTVDNILD